MGPVMMPFRKIWLSELRTNGETAQPTRSPSSPVSLQRGSHAVLEKHQPSWDLSPPTGLTFQLKPCCLASAWSTTPAPFHLHHGFCSSMPIFQIISDLPLEEQPIPREASDARGWGCPRPYGCLLLVGVGPALPAHREPPLFHPLALTTPDTPMKTSCLLHYIFYHIKRQL